MGEVVGAGLLAHVPTIVLPEEIRRELNHGEDITLPAGAGAAAQGGLRNPRLRHGGGLGLPLGDDGGVRGDRAGATTRAVHLRGAAAGDVPAALRLPGRPGAGAPASPPRQTSTAPGSPRSTTTICRSSTRPPTCGSSSARACRTSGGSRSGSARPRDTEDNLRLGRALGDAIAESDRKVVLIASGALSHTFWPLRKLRDHEAAGSSTSSPPSAAAADLERLAWFRAGDHARVLDTMPEFYRFRPESRFGHYLMMIGALGEGDCPATARQYGEYENSIGTGQVHLWFDRPEGGFPRPRRTPVDPTTSARTPAPTSPPPAELAPHEGIS